MAAKKKSIAKPVMGTEKEPTIVTSVKVQTDNEIANKVLNEVEGLLGNFVGENAKDESNCFSNKVCKKDWSKLRAKYVI